MLKTAIATITKNLATVIKEHETAIEKRGGYNAPYRGRECDKEEIALDLLCSKFRDELKEAEKVLAKLVRKQKKLVRESI